MEYENVKRDYTALTNFSVVQNDLDLSEDLNANNIIYQRRSGGKVEFLFVVNFGDGDRTFDLEAHIGFLLFLLKIEEMLNLGEFLESLTF
jgi:hypothetical protein